MGRVYDATWGRVFTAWYGLAMRMVDESGLRETRREVLAGASGRTLEIGSGTGANLYLYPSQVDELVLTDPDPHMQKALRHKLREQARPNTELVQAPAEKLPFEDSSFDCVACTMVLCTVPNPAEALAEAARVLKPGGRFLFLEHVRAEDPRVASWQDRLERPWRFLADGCHCNRDTVATIAASPLTLERVEQGQMPKSPPIVRPLATGRARLSA